jgi:hypothetical protein
MLHVTLDKLTTYILVLIMINYVWYNAWMCSYKVMKYKYLIKVKYVQRSDCCDVYKDRRLNAIVYYCE